MSRSNRIRLILAVAILIIMGDGFLPPISQVPDYHLFADTKKIFGIPNFFNVVSNLPFLLVGGLGLWRVNDSPGLLPNLKIHYRVFFLGVFLTGIGSAYYHWNPNNTTLVWDRLPMTLGFMGLFSVIVGEHVNERLGKRMLLPAIAIGLFSIAYWHWTESLGRGDLRLYALVQFLPLLTIPLMLWLLPSRFDTTRPIWLGLLAYGSSKLFEHFDHEIQAILGVVGGHPIKHLAAALGTYFLYIAIRQRRLVVEVEDWP